MDHRVLGVIGSLNVRYGEKPCLKHLGIGLSATLTLGVPDERNELVVAPGEGLAEAAVARGAREERAHAVVAVREIVVPLDTVDREDTKAGRLVARIPMREAREPPVGAERADANPAVGGATTGPIRRRGAACTTDTASRR